MFAFAFRCVSVPYVSCVLILAKDDVNKHFTYQTGQEGKRRVREHVGSEKVSFCTKHAFAITLQHRFVSRYFCMIHHHVGSMGLPFHSIHCTLPGNLVPQDTILLGVPNHCDTGNLFSTAHSSLKQHILHGYAHISRPCS